MFCHVALSIFGNFAVQFTISVSHRQKMATANSIIQINFSALKKYLS